MKEMRRFAVISVLAALMVTALGSSPSSAQSRAHVYLLRGLMNIFSLGMDTLADKLQRHGVYATVHNHSEWQSLANQAAAAYRAGTEGPIILIGHSLGADAVMEMAAYLGTKGIPVALVVPFDGTEFYTASSNVGRVFNLTHAGYGYIGRGAGFHGSIANVDVTSDKSVDHLNIDKSARLHARVISEVLAVIGSGHRSAQPTTAHNHNAPGAVTSPTPAGDSAGKPEDLTEAPGKPADGTTNTIDTVKPLADSGTPVIALPEKPVAGASSGMQ